MFAPREIDVMRHHLFKAIKNSGFTGWTLKMLDNIPCIIVQPSKSALFKSSLVPLEVSLVGVIISAKLGFSSCIERWSRRTNRNEVISYRSCSSTPHGNRFDKSSPDIGV